MNYRVEVLRFHQGQTKRGQAPEAIVQAAPDGMPAEAGDLLVVLVDLSPNLPHRAREVRTVAAETYWRSTGSIIARLRRALTEANRHLIRRNETSPPEEQSAGSITCAIFRGKELFLGQVGAANAFLHTPQEPAELFPRQVRLFPLGASLPPVINLGYAELSDGSHLILATGELAEKQARNLWEEQHADREEVALLESLQTLLAKVGATGTLISIRCEDAEEDEPPQPASHIAPWARARKKAPAPSTTAFSQKRSARAWRFRLFNLFHAPRIRFPHLRRPSLRPLVQRIADIFLPHPISGGRKSPPPVPSEHSLLMGGMALGLLLVIFFITLTTYLQWGGQQRSEALLAEVQEAQRIAYDVQTEEAWSHVITLCDRVLALDPQNEEAKAIREQAQIALDALNRAALLQTYNLTTLGSARQVRRLLVIHHWLYILDPDRDTLKAYPLSQDGLTLQGDAPLTILEKGLTLMGEPVGDLVDMAWLMPNIFYRGGALLIYGDGGILYTYEPDLGPNSCTLTHLTGEPIPPAAVTSVDTYGESLYLLQRQSNQILRYQPHNGIFDNPPRPYFSEDMAPPLGEALDMAIDGRIYLLMGNGQLQAYQEGVPDLSFRMEAPPDGKFLPRAMAMEKSTEGVFYLVDPQEERIAVLDKRGHFLHQYRLEEGKMLRSIEAIAVSEDPPALYILTGDTLYAAPFPAFVQPQEEP